jgi:hypothetical protein
MKTISQMQRDRAAERLNERILRITKPAILICAAILAALVIGHIATKAMANTAHTVIHAGEAARW